MQSDHTYNERVVLTILVGMAGRKEVKPCGDIKWGRA